MGGSADEETEGTPEVSHNKFRFCIVFGFLMEEFHAGHFMASFTNLNSIDDADAFAINGERRYEGEGNSGPDVTEMRYLEGGAMKKNGGD